MGLLAAISDSLDGWFARDAGPPRYMGAQTGYVAGPMYVDAFGAKRAPSGAELVEQYKSIIYSCTVLNAFGVARVPLRLMVDSTKGSGRKPREVARPRSIARSYHEHLRRSGYLARSTASHQDVQEITEHPLLWALDNPDPQGQFSRVDIIALMVAYCDIVGVGYLKIDSPGEDSPPQYLWPMQSQYVVDIKLPGLPLMDCYSYFGVRYPADEVLRFRCPTPSLRDPYGRGYSPTYAALQYAQLEDKYVAIQDQLLGQGPRPNILVSTKDASMPLGPAEQARLRVDLQRQHAQGMAGGALVVDGAVDVKTLTYSPTDLSGMKLSEYDLERTCNVFGTPVSYFTRETNLANLQAAETQHARMGVEPRCHTIAGTLTRLAQRYDERLFFAFDPAVEEDKERQARIIDMGLKNGRLTINEANIDSPWEPKPWGDEPWMPGTLVQPSMAQQKHEQGMEMAAAGAEAMQDAGGQPGAVDGGDDDDGGDGRGEDRGVPGVDAGPRLDAILSGLEKSLGL